MPDQLDRTDKPWIPRPNEFKPRGGSQFLEKAIGEVKRFVGQRHWRADRDEFVRSRVYDIAQGFLINRWIERLYPPKSRTSIRKALKDLTAAVHDVHQLARFNIDSLRKASRYWRGSAHDFFYLMLNDMPDIENAFRSALHSEEFKKKGRARRWSARLGLVVETFGLMEEVAGHRPGFGREAGASPSPIARTVMAIYQYATGETARKYEFDPFIAQAEARKKESALTGYQLLKQEFPPLPD